MKNIVYAYKLLYWALFTFAIYAIFYRIMYGPSYDNFKWIFIISGLATVILITVAIISTLVIKNLHIGLVRYWPIIWLIIAIPYAVIFRLNYGEYYVGEPYAFLPWNSEPTSYTAIIRTPQSPYINWIWVLWSLLLFIWIVSAIKLHLLARKNMTDNIRDGAGLSLNNPI
ncbi:MAG: hypothetical protein Q7S37_02820 [bacterium]|nr:hypothetical protein [bacterium]